MNLDDQQSLPALVGDDPLRFPQVCRVADALKRIRIYRDWTFGRLAPMRHPEPTNLATSCWTMGQLGSRTESAEPGAAKQQLLQTLRGLYAGISDLRVNIEHDKVNVYLREGRVEMPATRLSDGTIRYLCLLAILCHPKPPPLARISHQGP